MHLASPSNERLKHARRVRDGRERDCLFVEGLRLAEEALRSQLEIETAFIEVDLGEREQRLIERLTQRGVAVHSVASEAMASLGDTVTTQGVILLAKRPAGDAAQVWSEPHPLMLGFDRLQDPGNAGTLLRTAEAAGVSGIVAMSGSVDLFSPKVLRSAMGSAFRLPILTQATPDMLFSNAERVEGLRIVAAAGTGELDYDAYDWCQPTLLLVGNEAQGVSREWLERCDERLRIPMAHGVESLNVAAAGAVMLFEAARQRRRQALGVSREAAS